MARLLINMISKLSNTKETDIDLTTTFEYIGFDIIDLAELIMIIEDKLEINASIDTYYSKTVGELINHINKSNKVVQLN